MARTTGFTVTAKFFLPSPKDDFKAQAAAATLMSEIQASGKLSPEFLEQAEVIDVSGKYGSKAE